MELGLDAWALGSSLASDLTLWALNLPTPSLASEALPAGILAPAAVLVLAVPFPLWDQENQSASLAQVLLSVWYPVSHPSKQAALFPLDHLGMTVAPAAVVPVVPLPVAACPASEQQE